MIRLKNLLSEQYWQTEPMGTRDPGLFRYDTHSSIINIEPDDIRDLADKLKIPWDDNVKFVNWIFNLTGKCCLDKLSKKELRTVYFKLLDIPYGGDKPGSPIAGS